MEDCFAALATTGKQSLSRLHSVRGSNSLPGRQSLFAKKSRDRLDKGLLTNVPGIPPQTLYVQQITQLEYEKPCTPFENYLDYVVMRDII
jgi:hypothetical protein